MIIQRGAQFADRRKGGRTAIACSREVDYGLSRMFQTFASLQHIPFEIRPLAKVTLTECKSQCFSG
jgi:hypothetical protein